jgi:hypothetical protein
MANHEWVVLVPVLLLLTPLVLELTDWMVARKMVAEPIRQQQMDLTGAD